MAEPNLRSALLVEVPEAEPLVRQWRMDLDPHAALRVPAHITLLFPFAPPPLISTTILDRLGELLTADPMRSSMLGCWVVPRPRPGPTEKDRPGDCAVEIDWALGSSTVKDRRNTTRIGLILPRS